MNSRGGVAPPAHNECTVLGRATKRRPYNLGCFLSLDFYSEKALRLWVQFNYAAGSSSASSSASSARIWVTEPRGSPYISAVMTPSSSVVM